MVRETVDQIRTSLESGEYTNAIEAKIKQGVVLPLLQALDWPVFDTSVVTPEFPVESRWVDYALCENKGRPKIFVEVKKIGQANTGDRQLFEYAFHQGIPMAILTDGKEWSFYLPAEEGPYEERRVYKLDLIERSPIESAERLHRYLQFRRVISGEALSAARNDYRDVARDRLIADSMPKAWYQLLSGPDELLVDLLADKVEDICGYKPDPDACTKFIMASIATRLVPDDETPTPPRNDDSDKPPIESPSDPPGERGYKYRGRFYPGKFAWQVVQRILLDLAEEDPEFLQRFAAKKHGSKRRFVARSAIDLYPGRPDFAQHSVELTQGWYMGTHYSRASFMKYVQLACRVANVEFGKDLVMTL